MEIEGISVKKLIKALENQGVELITTLKKNMKKQFIEPIKKYWLRKRGIIEKIIYQLKFSDPSWTYEPKFDGERTFAYFQSGDLRLFSRNKQNLNKTYPDLLEVLQNQKVKIYCGWRNCCF